MSEADASAVDAAAQTQQPEEVPAGAKEEGSPSPSPSPSVPEGGEQKVDPVAAEAAPAKKEKLRSVVEMGGGAYKCVICEKRSYPAETYWFEKLPYHKECFQCTNCKEKIQSLTNAAQHEQELYCTRCFATLGLNRLQAQVKWVPKTGAAAASNTIKGLGGGGNPCVACSKTCYPAESVTFDSKLYHQECLTCSECSVKCTLANVNKFDDKLFCSRCWDRGGYNQKQLDAKKAAFSASGAKPASAVAAKFAGLGGGGNPCVACNKTCYPAEGVNFDSKLYHQECLACTDCTNKCTLSNVNKFDDKLYCTRCWEKGGYGLKQLDAKKASLSASGAKPVAAKFATLGGGGNPCVACSKTCYPAEGVTYDSKLYHQECLACSECSVKCTLANVNKFEDKLYCSRCWDRGGLNQKQLDAKKASAKPNAVAAKFATLGGGGTPCVACNKTCYPAESVTFDSKLYHQECLTCSECSNKCTLATVNKFDDKLFCSRCWDRGGYSRKQLDIKWEKKESGSAGAAVAAKFAGLGGGGEKCSKCTKTVYPAERIVYETVIYHSDCFACTNCASRIVPTAAQHKQKVPYCNKCFQELGLWRADA